MGHSVVLCSGQPVADLSLGHGVRHRADFRHDFDLMYNNCRTFNEGSEVLTHGKTDVSRLSRRWHVAVCHGDGCQLTGVRVRVRAWRSGSYSRRNSRP